MAVATQKEVVEMDVSGILNPPSWLEDETEYDIEAIKRFVDCLYEFHETCLSVTFIVMVNSHQR